MTNVQGIGVWLACCLCLVTGADAGARSFPDLKFNQLTVKDGLSTNEVWCTFEDSRGIMWIGTSQGLNRYDGTGFRIYQHRDNDSTTPAGNIIRSIAEDPEHYLWLGTDAGLSRFDPRTGKCRNYRHDTARSNSLADNGQCAPFTDSKGRLWLATGKGVQLFDYHKDRFITYTTPPPRYPLHVRVGRFFHRIVEDRQHRLWALGYSGLCLIDEQQQRLQRYEQLGTGNASTFCQMPDNRIYLGSPEQGLLTFDPGQYQYQPVMLQPAPSSPVRVRALSQWEDNNGDTWLCAGIDGGLALLEAGSNHWKEYTFQRDNPVSFPAFTVYQITRDSRNRLWLATDNGIAIVDPYLQYFDNLRLYLQTGNTNPRSFGLPNNILQTRQYTYLTSLYGKGVYLADKSWKLLRHITAIPPGAAADGNRSVNSIFDDGRGNLWFSTDAGLIRQRGKQYRLFLPPGADTAQAEAKVISKIYARKDGLFWIRARSNGLYLFDPEHGRFLAQYKPDGLRIDGAVYACLPEGPDGLWVGAVGGISRYDPGTGSFIKVPVTDMQGRQTRVRWVTDITKDKYGTVWAASASGLVKIDPAQGRGILMDTRSGLPEQNLKRILADTTGCLWIPSQYGIIRYDGSNKFNYFNINDGLPYQYEGYGFFEADEHGNFLLGFQGIVTRFNPYQVRINEQTPHLVLMDIEADGKPIALLEPARQPEIRLQPGTRLVHIHFALTNYTSPLENKYYYRLGGADGVWQQVKGGDIDLGSLPKGNHILYLKGCNNDGVFSKVSSLSVVVLPYWYETLLFKVLVACVTLLLVFWLLRIRIAAIRKEALFRQKLAETEMQLLRSRMNPHFIFNCLNSIKLYVAENNREAAMLYLDKFSRLIRLVLENSQNERVVLEQDLEALKLYLEMERIRFKEKLRYEIRIDSNVDAEYLEVPPMLIQPYVENAIWHGLMHREEGGTVSIGLEYDVEAGVLAAVIRDDGVGRRKALALKSKSAAYRSLGMSITGERIGLINERYQVNATVTVRDLYLDSGEAAGTEVVLRIPVKE